MAKRARFVGPPGRGRWIDPQTGRWITNAAAARRLGVPVKAIHGKRPRPAPYTEIKVVSRMRIGSRQFEVMRVKTLKLPSKRELRATKKALKKDAAKVLADYTKRPKIGKLVSRHAGTSTRRVSRVQRKDFTFKEVREMRKRRLPPRGPDGRFRKARKPRDRPPDLVDEPEKEPSP